MNEIEKSIEFCKTLEPAFASLLRGSPAADIEALERAAGRPLIAAHRTFLEAMGEDTGALRFGNYTTSPAVLLEARGGTVALPGGAELFAVPTGDADGDIMLVPREDGSTAVVRRGEIEELVAGSLEELICLPMLNAYYVNRQPLRKALVGRELREGMLADCRRIGELFGFEPYWFSSEMTWAARRERLVVVAKQAPGKWFSLGIAGTDEFELGVILRTFERELDLEPYR
jgi:hypothetical protein